MIPHFNEVTDIPQNELKQTNKIISFNIPGWLGFFSHLDTICLYTCSMMLPTSIIKSQNRSVANARSGKKMHFYMQGVTETHFLISTCKQSPELCTQIANKELKHNHVVVHSHVWLHLRIWKSFCSKLIIHGKLVKAGQPQPLKQSRLIYEQNQRKEIQVIRHMVAFPPLSEEKNSRNFLTLQNR